MKKLVLVAILLNAVVSLKAQQDILVSQYMFNHLLVNPGYAGSKEYMQATLLYRKQWTGWAGAPETQIATLHGPLGLTNFGWGAMISHDKIGVQDRTDAYANAAYHIKLKEGLKLGLGIRAGGAYYNYSTPSIVWDANDPAFNENLTRFVPAVGAGAYLYSRNLYAGLSFTSVDPEKTIGSPDANAPNRVRHYFGAMGYAWEINSQVVLKPSVLIKYVVNAPVEADFNLNVLLAQTIWVGASYRTGDAIVAMVEFQLSRKLKLGYAYDYTITNVSDFSSGSHEIMLGYDFGYDIQKIKTPRYF